MTTTTNVNLSNVNEASMADLVAFYNANSGPDAKPIKKFETRAKGVERCTKILNAIVARSPEAAKSGPRLSMNLATGKLSVKRPAANSAEPSAMGAIAKTVVKADPKPATAKSAPAKKAPAAKKPAARGASASAGGRRLFTEDGVITIVHKGENPKRGTAADRYDLYRSGMTVKAYIAAGGQRRDVVWDFRKGWITVKG